LGIFFLSKESLHASIDHGAIVLDGHQSSRFFFCNDISSSTSGSKSKILLPLDSLMSKIQCLLLFFSRFEELSPAEGYRLTVSRVRVFVTLCNTLPSNHFTLRTYQQGSLRCTVWCRISAQRNLNSYITFWMDCHVWSCFLYCTSFY
jgi:hypothetical protein